VDQVDASAAGSATPLDDVRQEALRLAQEAMRRDLPVRLLGGTAVWVRSPSAKLPGLSRTYGDVDVISLRSARHQITRFFEAMGYVPDELFNAIHGAQRLNFMDPAHNRPLDVLLDRFVMCHTLDLRRRLTLEPLTIPLPDLLLTKLQVVRINEKDIRDLVVLVADHPVTGPSGEALDLKRLSSVLGRDWGFEHTVRANLARLRESLDDYDVPAEMRTRVVERVDAIVAALNQGKKTIGWRARGIVGERFRWYELPEDVNH